MAGKPEKYPTSLGEELVEEKPKHTLED